MVKSTKNNIGTALRERAAAVGTKTTLLIVVLVAMMAQPGVAGECRRLYHPGGHTTPYLGGPVPPSCRVVVVEEESCAPLPIRIIHGTAQGVGQGIGALVRSIFSGPGPCPPSRRWEGESYQRHLVGINHHEVRVVTHLKVTVASPTASNEECYDLARRAGQRFKDDPNPEQKVREYVCAEMPDATVTVNGRILSREERVRPEYFRDRASARAGGRELFFREGEDGFMVLEPR